MVSLGALWTRDLGLVMSPPGVFCISRVGTMDGSILAPSESCLIIKACLAYERVSLGLSDRLYLQHAVLAALLQIPFVYEGTHLAIK